MVRYCHFGVSLVNYSDSDVDLADDLLFVALRLSDKLTILDLYSSTVNKWLGRRCVTMVDVCICEFLQTVDETTKQKLCQ